MTLKVAFQQDNNTPKVLNMSADVLASLEQYRLTLMDMEQVTEPDNTISNQLVHRYDNVQSMIVGEFKRFLVQPALQMFPPAPVAQKKADLDVAQAALQAAQDATVSGVLQ